ncbi:cupin domain-containing protein [Balneolaceae bacterium ANBcel3]|nr:cupin domain-containing protein [Balneolaceae bacterium ANBcel3]
MSNSSKIIRCTEFTWPGIQKKEYKTDGTGFKDISRYTLLGNESDEQALGIQVRYFEIEENGYSSLERHQHPHTVFITRGRGHILLDEEYHAIEPMDTVYVAPGSIHQFHADRGSILGFFCIVDRDRDRPQTPSSKEELKEWIRSAKTRHKARI